VPEPAAVDRAWRDAGNPTVILVIYHGWSAVATEGELRRDPDPDAFRWRKQRTTWPDAWRTIQEVGVDNWLQSLFGDVQSTMLRPRPSDWFGHIEIERGGAY